MDQSHQSFFLSSHVIGPYDKQASLRRLTQRNPVGGCLTVDPERHPGQNDQQTAGQVHLDQEKAGMSPEIKEDRQNGVWTCPADNEEQEKMERVELTSILLLVGFI